MLGTVCKVSQAHIGSLGCSLKSPFKDTVALFIARHGFAFATFTDFADKTKWEDAIKSGEIIPLKGIVEIDDQSEDAQYFESTGGVRVPGREGSYRNIYMFSLPFEVHKALRSLANGNFDIFTFDSAGNIVGTSPDGVKVTGMVPSMFNVEKMAQARQDNTPAWTRVAVDISDVRQFNNFGVYVEPEWSPISLEPIAPVHLSVTSSTTTKIVLKVVYVAGIDANGELLEVPITGILQADFKFVGTTPTADSMVDNLDGTYTFPGVALVAGTADLVDPSLATTVGTPIFNVDGPQAVTVN